MRTAIFVSVFLCIAFASNAQMQNADSAELSSRLFAFQQTILAIDTVTLQSFYTDDAVSLTQNNKIEFGKDQVVGRWKRTFRMPFQLTLIPVSIKITSDRDAACFGTFSITVQSQQAASGKWLQLWRLENGTWKIYLEMDNFDSRKK